MDAIPLELVRDQMRPVLIGCCLNIALYGVIVCWQSRYWISYREDHWAIQVLVAVAVCTTSAGSFGAFMQLYELTVTKYGNPLALSNPGWQASCIMLTNNISAAATHAFLVARLHRFARRLWITAILILASVASLACGVWTLVLLETQNVLFVDAQTRPAVISADASAAGVDALLCACFVYFLAQLGSYQYVHTRHIMRKLFTVALCSAAALVALKLACMCTYVFMRGSAVPASTFLVVGPCYTITLLINLSLRRSPPRTSSKGRPMDFSNSNRLASSAHCDSGKAADEDMEAPGENPSTKLITLPTT